MADQKRWQAWVFSRRINRTFKILIERYYVDQWLDKTYFTVDCEDDLVVGGARVALSIGYWLKGFDVVDQRLAVYEPIQRPEERCVEVSLLSLPIWNVQAVNMLIGKVERTPAATPRPS